MQLGPEQELSVMQKSFGEI